MANENASLKMSTLSNLKCAIYDPVGLGARNTSNSTFGIIVLKQAFEFFFPILM